MASRSISVKVATPKVIKSLESRLEEIKKNKADEAVNEDKFQKKYDKYKSDLLKYAVANFKQAYNVRTNTRSWGSVPSINIDFDIPLTDTIPVEPRRDFEIMADYQYKETVEEIENAIRILKMTDEETVNASTFKSIAKYL